MKLSINIELLECDCDYPTYRIRLLEDDNVKLNSDIESYNLIPILGKLIELTNFQHFKSREERNSNHE